MGVCQQRVRSLTKSRALMFSGIVGITLVLSSWVSLVLAAEKTFEPVAARTREFVESVGVNIHPNNTNEPYGNVERVLNSLSFLRVKYVRAPVPRPASRDRYLALTDAGYLFDILVMKDPKDAVKDIAVMAPNIKSIEGWNEVDVTPVTFAGLSGNEAVIAQQKSLYEKVYGSPFLNNENKVTPVINFTVGGSSHLTDAFGDLSAFADYGNVHAYVHHGLPPYMVIPATIKGISNTPGRPFVLSETGFYTLVSANEWGGVTESVAAKWTTCILFDSFRDGIARTFIYELLDGALDGTTPNREHHFGLFRFDGTPKRAAIAIRNLFTLLTDDGVDSAAFPPSKLEYTLDGMPWPSWHMLLEKSDGTRYLILWTEPKDLWDSAALKENAVTPRSVNVRFARPFSSLQVYDILLDDPSADAPVSIINAANADRVTVGLVDHPVIIQLSKD